MGSYNHFSMKGSHAMGTACGAEHFPPRGWKRRPWIPKLYKKMVPGLRQKLRTNPKARQMVKTSILSNGKVNVPGAQLICASARS